MNLADQLHEDLRDVTFPAALVPPGDLADTVLRTARRRRRTLAVTLGAAVAVLAALAVPVTLTTRPTAGPGTGTTAGGPQVVHVYTEGERSRLLDVRTGKYVKLPFTVVLSPDLTRAAVNDNGRLGLADRAELTRDTGAVRWLDLPPGNGPSWSPDGAALLWTTLEKSPDVRFTAHRYDIATARVTTTQVPTMILGSTVGWAADSHRYLVLLRGAETDTGVEPGPLQYLDPDGTLGPRLEGSSGSVDGAPAYSPSRRYVLTDASDIMSARPLPSPVLDTATGKVVTLVRAGTRPVGWYDETTAVCLVRDAGTLELMDVTTGATVRTVKLPGAAQLTGLQLGPSTGVPTADLTF